MKRILESLSFAQPYLIGVVVIVLFLLLMPACSTTGAKSAGRTRDLATTAATTGVGAYIGAKEGNGKARDAAAGAVAGFVAGEAIGYFNNKAQRDAFESGYIGVRMDRRIPGPT